MRMRLREYFPTNLQADRLAFKDIFRHAARHGLLSIESAERWFEYRDNRDDTAHDYGEGFAETTLKLLPDFIADAQYLAIVVQQPFGWTRMNERLHLADRHRALVETILNDHLRGVEVWAYGSRVNGRSHEGSDLDLVLRSQGLSPLDPSLLAAVAQGFQDSRLPILVDVHDWAVMPESFRAEIQRNHVVLIPGDRQDRAGQPCALR